jgi:hypothetical protein
LIYGQIFIKKSKNYTYEQKSSFSIQFRPKRIYKTDSQDDDLDKALAELRLEGGIEAAEPAEAESAAAKKRREKKERQKLKEKAEAEAGPAPAPAAAADAEKPEDKGSL